MEFAWFGSATDVNSLEFDQVKICVCCLDVHLILSRSVQIAPMKLLLHRG